MLTQSRLIEIQNALSRHARLELDGRELKALVDELIQHRDAAVDFSLRKSTDVEVLAERLAKVEDRLAKGSGLSVLKENVALRAERAGLQDENDALRNAHQRIDDLRAIIGTERSLDGEQDMYTRVTALETQVNHLALAASEQEECFAKLDAVIEALRKPVDFLPETEDGKAVPLAGPGDVLPAPVRGDRVQLIGARATNGREIANGWYDVIGTRTYSSGNCTLQIVTRESSIANDTVAWLPWVLTTDPGIRDVRRAGEIGDTHEH